MSHYALKWRVTLVMVVGVCGGCFSIRMSDKGPYVTIKTGYIQCTAKTVTGVIPVLTRDANHSCYHLELRATGSFVIHDVNKVVTKRGLTPRIYFGIMPGMHQDGPYKTREEMNEEDDSLWWLLQVGCVIATPYALFIEPFGEYHPYPGVASCALLGFAKRLLDEGGVSESVDFRETGSSHPSSTAKLYGYCLEIEGRRYDGSAGSIEIGTYDFVDYGKYLESGRKLHAKFITAPSVRQDSDEFLGDLEGFEFEIVCP